MLRPAQGQAASLAPSAIGLAKALAGMGALVGVLALAVAVGCMALWLSESNLVWLVVGAGFLLLGLAGGVGLWAAGRMAAQMARVSLEMGQIARRVEAHTPAAPAPIVTEYAPAPAMHGTEDHQAILDAIEQLRGEVLLTDEQRRDRSTRLAAARVAEAAARFDEDLADGRLEAAQERVSELAALGASPEQVSILRDRVLTFFAERADRAILAGDFRRGQDWIDELAQARPDDRRVVELGTRLREAQASLSAVEFAKQKKYVEDMLAVADYDRAENAVEALVDRLGETEEIKAFAEMVKGEAAAFREEQRRRMLAEVRQFAEARQWRKALGAARDLASEHPRRP
ncbi:MAG: hypothetical protein NT031_01605, partial [Planctomycetota bacterium]|nr:hypothetical protein [Planctomycetota bacterium]